MSATGREGESRRRASAKQSARQKRQLADVKELFDRNPRMSLRGTGTYLGVSFSAVRTRLRKLGKKPLRRGIEPELPERVKRQRKEWCAEMLEKIAEDPTFLQKIVWTDEKIFKPKWLERGSTQNMRVRVDKSIRKRDVPAELATVERKAWGQSVMAAWGVTARHKLDPYFVDAGAKINSQAYQALVSQTYAPYIFARVGDDFHFQQDNAPSHVSKSTMKYLIREFGEDRLLKPKFPPLSPDLTVLDYSLWAILDQRLHSVWKDRVNSEATLRAAVKTEINLLSQDVIRRAIEDDMPRRLRACLAADGGRFERQEKHRRRAA